MSVDRPQFVQTDPEAIQADLLAKYEAMTGRPLYPSQPDVLLVHMLSYVSALHARRVQETAESLLVPFAAGAALDALAAQVGVTREAPSRAICTMKATLSGVDSRERLVPAGLPLPVKGGGLTFEVAEDLRIPAGALEGLVRAQAVEPGTAANGYLAGEVGGRDLLPGVALFNVDATQGGAEAETDDRLRLRTLEAPEGFTVAGSRGAYRFHAFAAHPDVADVVVLSPGGLRVQVYLLLQSGVPGVTVLEAVRAHLSADTVRPLCDVVEVLPAVRVPYALQLRGRYLPGADVAALEAAVKARGEAWAADRRAAMGRDLVPSRIVAACWVEGLADLEVLAPIARSISETEWADCTGVTVTLEAASV